MTSDSMVKTLVLLDAPSRFSVSRAIHDAEPLCILGAQVVVELGKVPFEPTGQASVYDLRRAPEQLEVEIIWRYRCRFGASQVFANVERLSTGVHAFRSPCCIQDRDR